MLAKYECQGFLHGYRVAKGALFVSHLFFTNNNYSFSKQMLMRQQWLNNTFLYRKLLFDEATMVKQCLSLYIANLV